MCVLCVSGMSTMQHVHAFCIELECCPCWTYMFAIYVGLFGCPHVCLEHVLLWSHWPRDKFDVYNADYCSSLFGVVFVCVFRNTQFCSFSVIVCDHPCSTIYRSSMFPCFLTHRWQPLVLLHAITHIPSTFHPLSASHFSLFCSFSFFFFWSWSLGFISACFVEILFWCVCHLSFFVVAKCVSF